MPLDKNGTPQPSMANSQKFRDSWDSIFGNKKDYISGVCDHCQENSNELKLANFSDTLMICPLCSKCIENKNKYATK